MVFLAVSVQASLAVLNLTLAFVMARADPRRGVNVVLFWLFALNGVSAVARAFQELATGEIAIGRANAVHYLANVLSLLPLVLLPFVFPERRVGRRGAGIVLAATGLLLVPTVFASLYRIITGNVPASLGWLPDFDHFLVSASGAIGALLIVATFLKARQHTRLDKARFVLAAFLLKLSARLATPSALWTLEVPRAPISGRLGLAAVVSEAAARLGDFMVVFAVFAVLIALGVAMTRAALGRRPPVPAGYVAFVLAFFLLGFLLVPLGIAGDFEYQLVRPLLLAFAILRYQLVEVDLRRNAAAFGVAGFAAIVALPLLLIGSGGPLGLDMEVKVAMAVAVTVAVAAFLFWSLAAVAFGPGGEGGDRRHLVYRAALEAAGEHDAGRAGTTDEAFLRVLRERLGISDREHALLLGGATASAGSALVPGRRFLLRYDVLEALGSGAESEVHLARDVRLDRPVAIKRLREAAPTPSARQRFEREVRTTGSIQHPNVLRVLDVEVVGQDVYLVLEHAAGGSLKERLGGKVGMDAAAFERVTVDVLSGLAAVHARGLVHRDVKPSNILFRADGMAMVADLGIAREFEVEDTMGFTREGTTPGTVRYMAPEQARGHRLTPAADVYSIAATLLEAWTGRPWVEPRRHESAIELQMRVAAAGAFDRVVPGPGELTAWFARALHPDPARRFADAGAMLAAFPLSGAGSGGRETAADKPKTSRRRSARTS